MLPGALYLAVAAIAVILGRRHALDLPLLADHLTAWAASPGATRAGGQVVLLGAVLAAAAGVGLAAQALNSGAERLILAADWRTWRTPLRQLAAAGVQSRRTQWVTAHRDYHRLYDQAEQARQAGTPPGEEQRTERHAAYEKIIRISLEPPDRPTWSGDRIHAAAARLDRDLNVDLPTLWPHLPDSARTEITTARAALARATAMGGWAVLYLPLTWWWWPAALITALLATIAWQRTRTTAEGYALLLEAATRLHLKGLAENLGIDPADKTPAALGQTLTHQLHTQPPPPPAEERQTPLPRPNPSPPTASLPPEPASPRP
ncbi:hypothetical protein SAMN05421869_107373 [Nonomuraea jiangxiensis]|uniref:Vegetative cell wall protein gp1 n=1 Tax=Nonomuraea jiangxiensis TaxID=633440 RepID=A0A1G8P9T5_9ACTN|nr:hypothetical protein SAMN05421869_107373 [Nonomuraea jiangxiensis]